MKSRLLLSTLLLALTSVPAFAYSPKFTPAYLGRPYWLNPGALCHDSSHSISFYGGFTPSTSPNMITGGSDPKFTLGWFNAELKLPQKMGAVGIQMGYESSFMLDHNFERTASLTYANGFSLGGGRLGIGIQADLNYRRISSWGTEESAAEDLQPDISAGLFYQHGPLKTGLSIQNVLSRPFEFQFNNVWGVVRIPQRRALNYLLMYDFRLTQEWTLQSSVIAGLTERSLSLHLNNTLVYKNKYQIGTSFSRRYNTGISINAGLIFGRANFFAILPVPSDLNYLTTEYQAGLAYRLGNGSK